MIIKEKKTSVLIVGAGPSGLMMAAQLLRNGIQPLIIDNKEGPTNESKALAVQARTLEIYRQLGIVDKVIPNGKQSKGVIFNQDGRQKASLSLNHVGDGKTPFPYILLYQQSKNERSLLDYLTLNCCPVYWNTTLTSLNQKTGSVEVVIKNNDGEYNLECDWVVGADGAHSVVRKQSHIPFSGDTYPHYFYLADVTLDTTFLNGEYIQLYLGKSGFAGFFPLPEEDRYRVIGGLPVEFGEREDIQLEELLPFLSGVTNATIKVVENHWFTTYKLHHRMAEKFRDQRCFLVGDAAHIHSPVGGQGMNTGLQDAYNLAWKLASVINGQVKPTILDSYANERMPVAKTLLKTTDGAFNLVTSTNWFFGILKKWILFNVLNLAWKSKSIKAAFFKLVSQTGISYRDSNINLHLSKSTQIKAGDRLPYLKVYDEKKEEETDLHEWCNKPGFTLIILGKFDEMYLFTLAKWITNKYPGMLNFFYLPPSGKNVDVFNAFEADPHKQKAIIVRPDMHIGFINDVVDIGMMDSYLQNVAGVIAKSLL
ncbi:MAG TPA: FAD-dependent monooxygenase [Mucilaginibacter sp.]|nr:FAD-dependent monooxygenase [Mucilaginibacter sp.]